MSVILYTRTYELHRGKRDYTTDLVTADGTVYSQAHWTALGIKGTNRPPLMIPFRGDSYIVSAFSRVLVRDARTRGTYPAGIRPPSSKLAVAKGLGAGGSTGNALCFISFVHKDGAAILAESDRSNVVQLDGMAGEGFVWSNIQATDPDQRATHVRGWRSMDGSDYRLAWEVPIGQTTVTENVTTERLLQVAPDLDQRQIPPAGIFYAVEFAGSMWYARTSDQPHRLWRSVEGYPQYVDPNNYVDTHGRETITAVARTPGNELLVFCEDRSYICRLTGSGPSDFILDRLDSSVGCINQRGIVEIHRRLWFPARDGYWIWDGAFHYAMKDVRPLWMQDWQENRLAYGSGFAVDDRLSKTLLYFTPRDPKTTYEGNRCGTICWVANYEPCEPSMGGERDQPDWTIDAYGRKASSAFYDSEGKVQIGWCDGQIRTFDDEDDNDDDDPLLKPMIVRHGHQLFGLPADSRETNGKSVKQFWASVESEVTGWWLYLLAGDEHAWRQVAPIFERGRYWRSLRYGTRKEGHVHYDAGVGPAVVWQRLLPETVHFWANVERVTGRGLTVEMRATSPVGWAYRGCGGALGPGLATRQVEFETSYLLLAQWRVLGETAWRDLPIRCLNQTWGNTTIELRFTANYHYGPATANWVQTTLTPDFTGFSFYDTLALPDLENLAHSIVVNADQRVEGVWAMQAADENAVVADPIAETDVYVASWEIAAQYNKNGGGWVWLDPMVAQEVAVAVGDTLEIRYLVYGSNLPLTLSIVGYQDGSYGDSVPVAAAGNGTDYGTYTEHFTVRGLSYDISGTIVDSEGRTLKRAVTVSVSA